MSKDASHIRIAIVDDHSLFREGIKLVLNQIMNFSVVFDSCDGLEFIRSLETSDYDVVLMDIEMPVLDGIESSRRALQIRPELKIIALTMFSDIGYYSRMIQAGVKGFILKKANKSELEHAIVSVYNSGNYFSLEILKKLAFEHMNPLPAHDHFTKRELEIIRLVCQGYTSPEISENLHISLKTVETHRFNILQKSNVRNTAGLILWAIRNRYFTVD
jgi:DNA-binding NarL/FixJ family response regulator